MMSRGNVAVERAPRTQSHSLVRKASRSTEIVHLEVPSDSLLEKNTAEQTIKDRRLSPRHKSKHRRPTSADGNCLKPDPLDAEDAFGPIEGIIKDAKPLVEYSSLASSAMDFVSGRSDPYSDEAQMMKEEDEQPLNAATTCQSQQHFPRDYSNPKRVPGTNLNVYPLVSADREFDRRYPYIIDLFKSAVDDHKSLKHHTEKINYDLRLCGSCPEDANFSILVFCADAIFKDLRSLLNSKHLRRHYRQEEPSILSNFPLFSHIKSEAKPSRVIVPFKLVFWRVAGMPATRMSKAERVQAQGQSGITVCGSTVTYETFSSTLGLIVNMDSKNYGLTVDHLFAGRSRTAIRETYIAVDQETESEICGFNIKGKLSDPERLNECWIDEISYEDLEYDRELQDSRTVVSDILSSRVTLEDNLLEQPLWNRNGYKMDPIWKENKSRPYLDWALIYFEDGECGHVNAFFTQDNPKQPRFISKVSNPVLCHKTPIYMISGVSGTREGTMILGKSYIGGDPGQDLCKAFNVALSGGVGIANGDCGSLVVDKYTNEIYGHVVASNPLGEAYVVPIQDTLDQIREAFDAEELSLPDPNIVLATLLAQASELNDTQPREDMKKYPEEPVTIIPDQPRNPVGLTEHETRCLLTEIIKCSKVSVETLLSVIKTDQIEPNWAEIWVPPARNLKACKTVFDELLSDSQVVSYHNTAGDVTPYINRSSHKRQFFETELSTPLKRTLHPKLSADMLQVSPIGDPGGISFMRKRGRPAKGLPGTRRAEAIARGESYPPLRATASKNSPRKASIQAQDEHEISAD